MRFSAESVALGAAILALPAAAAPVPAEAAQSHQGAQTQGQTSGEVPRVGYYDVPKQPGTAHLAQHGFESYHMPVNHMPVRPMEGTAMPQGMTGSASGAKAQGQTMPNKVQVNGRMVRVPQPSDFNEIERRSRSRTDTAVNGLNKASEVGGAVNDAVQVGTNLWDSAKNAWDNRRRSPSRTDTAINGLNKASDVGNAVNDAVQVGTNLWDSAKNAVQSI